MRRNIRHLIFAVVAVVASAVLVDVAYLRSIWPDWQALREQPVDSSAFMDLYHERRADDPHAPPLRQRWIGIERLPQAVLRAVVLAEDARFWQHGGVDVEALRRAFQRNLDAGDLVQGGSTISQQTAKNLFLRPARDPLRKWHELVLTLAMERRLSKRRILEIYLNIAEFGPGVYGVDAAARRYWDVPAYLLDRRQAVELAATLPDPKDANPATRTPAWERRVERIEGHLERFGLGTPLSRRPDR